jgi:hypothetical protein
MILPVVQSFHGELNHLLGSARNEKRDVLRRKFGTLAVKRLLRGMVRVFGIFGAVCHMMFFC